MKTFFLATTLLFSNLMVWGTKTKMMVRAKAKDAKFIGCSLGGAHIIVRNKLNQKILKEIISSILREIMNFPCLS